MALWNMEMTITAKDREPVSRLIFVNPLWIKAECKIARARRGSPKGMGGNLEWREFSILAPGTNSLLKDIKFANPLLINFLKIAY